MQARKSQLVGLLLTFCFGPLGMFYISRDAGLGWVMAYIPVVIVVIVLPFLFAPFWLMCMVASVILVNKHNHGYKRVKNVEPLAFNSYVPVGGFHGDPQSASLWHCVRDNRYEVRVGGPNRPSYDKSTFVFFSYDREEARNFYDRFLLAPTEMLANPEKPKYDKPLEERD